MDELTRVYSHEHKYKYYNQLYLSFCFYKTPACVWCVNVNLITEKFISRREFQTGTRTKILSFIFPIIRFNIFVLLMTICVMNF